MLLLHTIMEYSSRENESIVPSLTELEGFLTEHNSNVVWLFVATILSCGWIIYLTYYNSRNLGLILTLVLNRLYKNGYVHIGSFSFSVLSGKVMFREIYYINEDVSIRIQDGFLIFRWWKIYNPKQKQHDPKAETRLYITVNGFEFHVYNRYDLYAHLQELFGLEPTIIPKRANTKIKKNQEKAKSKLESIKTETQDPSSSWRSLIPVIKVDVSTGRLAFGNRFLPQTLCINFDDAFLTYTTKPPSSHLDQFMHIVKGKLENVRVMLVPSPRHVSLQNDEPPRLMGEGFVVMQSNDVDIYYYMDEPGVVLEETDENAEESPDSESTKLQDLPPCWGLDIVCGKGTDFNYGPWADRQREWLWKFFFPADYQTLKVTELAKPGKPRQILAFELRMNIIADATIDLLFTKNRETNAIHVNVGAGSYLEVNVPMTVGINGFSPTIKGQLLHVDATSSMLYRTLLEAEMLAFHLNAIYQRIWNMPQEWQCEIEVYKATYHFIFAQKNFFTDLIQDWASDSAPDIYSFVPYTWKLKVMFHQFEMIWAANQHNWIDCSTKQQENVYLAACGETLNIDFSLPFNDFVPETCNTKFCLKAENMDLRLFLPDCHPSRYAAVTLVNGSQPNKVTQASTSNETQVSHKTRKFKWRNVTQPEIDWIECWSVPNIQLCIDYTWHPIYPQKADEQLKQSLFETQRLTSRSSQKAAERIVHSPSVSQRLRIDPSELLPDKLHVELEMSPDSQIILYGPLLKALLSIKENYFGEDDMYTDFEEAVTSPVLSLSTSSSSGWTAVGVEENEKKESESGGKQIHPLTLRPWDISVLINLYKIHGRLPVHCSSDGSECPTVFLERLCFEMKKGYKETMLQLILSPVYIFVSDSYPRPSVDGLLREGHISLSGLQLRAHAMFSAEGLPLGSATLEYSWLIDVQAGLLTAKVTLPQLATLLEWGETFIFHVMCQEYELERPKAIVKCQHGVDQRFCELKLKSVPGPCQRSEELKYTMTRVAVDGADLFIVEHGCAASLKIGAIRIATCNLHNQAVGEGVSAVMQDVQLRQYIEQFENCRLGIQPTVLRRSCWLEAGSVNFGLITADVALAADHPAKHEVQREFLETHDYRTKRLWYLWLEDDFKNKRGKNKCGCLSGCKFYSGMASGQDFFKLDEMTPSTSSTFSTINTETDMFYGQSLLHPNEWIITKDISKSADGKTNGTKRKEWDSKSLGIDSERKNQSLQVPLQSHSSTSSSEENTSSTAALPLLASEKNSPSSNPDDSVIQMPSPVLSTNTEETNANGPTDVSGRTPVSPNNQDRSLVRSPLKRQASVSSTRLGSTKSLSAAIFGERQPAAMGVQFTSEVSRSDENVLDSPRQRRSFGSFPFTPSADSNTFHQYQSVDSSISVADSEAYFSAAEDFDPVSSDEGPGTYPGRKKRRRTQAVDYSRSTIYHSVEGPLNSSVNGDVQELKSYPIKTHASQASFVSALEGEEESTDHIYPVEGEKAVDSRPLSSQQIVMSCYLNYLTQLQVSNWSVKQPTNKRTSKSSLHRPLDLDTPTNEESSSSFDQLSVPMFKVIKQGLAASALLDRGAQLMGSNSSAPYTPLEKTMMENTDDETVTEQWSLDQPVSQTRTTAIVEVKGTVDIVLTPLVTEALDRYFEAMVHFVGIWHPAAIVDDLHAKVLKEALLNSKSASSETTTAKHEGRTSKIENGTTGITKSGQTRTNSAAKQDNVKIKGFQANVSIPKVNLCLLQASVEEPPTFNANKNVTQVSLVALCFDRISTQILMNRGIVEDGSNNPDAGRASVAFDKYVNASKMQPQSSGSLRSNAGAERGKELAAKLNIHRIHGQLRGLSTTDAQWEVFKKEFSLIQDQYIPLRGKSSTYQIKQSWSMKEGGGAGIPARCWRAPGAAVGGRQSGAVLYNVLGVLGKSNTTERNGVLKSGDSTGSPTGSGYSTDVSEDHLPRDERSPTSDVNGNSASEDQDEGVESDDLKKDLPLMPPPPDSSSMKLTMSEIWFSFAAPTNLHSHVQTHSRQLNILSTATPAISAWLIPIDQLKSSLNKLEMERTLRVCAVMGCIMTEALERKSAHFPLKSKYNRVTKLARYLQENPSCLLCNILHRYLQQADYSVIEDATMNNGLPALVTLKKGLVALARQWMKFIVVTPAFKGVSLLLRPAQLPKPQPASQADHQAGGLDNGGAIQSDTSADGAEFEFDAATVSEHTMLLESSRPPAGGTSSGPVTGSDIIRKLSKTNAHAHESALKIKGVHPYQSLSYTSGDTVADSPAHVSRAGIPTRDSPRKESLLSYLTGSFPSLHNLLEGTPQRSATGIKSSSLTRPGTAVAREMLSEHPLLSEPSSVSFYNWMSNAVSNRGSITQESPVPRSGHNSLPTGLTYNLPTIQSASDFNTVLSSDQNTLDGTQSQNSTSQDEIVGIEEGNQGPPAVQLADAQVVFKPLLSNTGIQSQDIVPLTYGMYFGEHLSFSGSLDCLRADIVDSDTSKERKIRRKRRQGMINLPPLDFKPALMFNTFCINAVVMDRPTCNQNSTNALSFHELNRHHQNTLHVNFTISCQSISQHVDMALVRLIHQFSTMIDDIKATQTDIKLSRYTAGSVSPTPTFKTRKHRDFRSSDFSRSSRGSLNGGGRGNSTKANKRLGNENNKRESRNKNSSGPTQRRTSKVSRKGSKDVVDHVTIHMDDSDSITVSEQSEPSAECWQNMYKLLNFYSLISDPTGILEKSSPDVLGPADTGGRSPTEPGCRVMFENEQDCSSPNKQSRKRSLVSAEPQHVTLIVFGVGMVNRTHLEADIGGLTMEAELKKIHGSFTVKEKMKDVLHQKMTETCATAHIGGVNIVLLEGITPNIQTVVKCSIAKSQALYSAQRGLKTNNTMVVKVGAISINIPQHPATLHSMMVRSSHQLSKQISDLIRQPTICVPSKEDVSTPQLPEKPVSSVNHTPVETNEFPQLPEGLEKKPIVLKFSALLDGITIGAALLPSLKAEYKMGRMKSHGMTGAQTRFTFELPNHRLRFQSKVTPVDMAALPPSASLNLPQVTMSGEYIMEEHESYPDKSWNADEFPLKQGNYLQGNYLRCVAEVGSFEHNLTTDLLNQLVFVQKVFMKEVNEVIQKVSGGEQPIPLWNEHDILMDGEKPKILLYSLNLQFKGIQVTATTPSMRAVRLETGLIELELSNRIQAKTQPGAGRNSSYLKLFGKCQVDLNLALGQIVKHQVYEEAGSDFHQVAYFKTRIGLRNALQEEISGAFDREAVLITLSRPIIYAQPVAFDRAVLFWLNYKAAYDNWNEQRMALHKDIHVATKEVVDKLPGIQQTSAQAFGTLFLQLTVNDLGICLPITSTIQANHTIDFDPGSAMVLTIESTLITACSSESLVSKGHFKNFCIRFADGFETSWDDWKPELQGDIVMNACVVPDGTYEVCSRTTGQAAADSSSAGTWTLNVLWKMCGIDVHMDPNIGKRLNALGNTMTTLTGEEEVDDIADLNSINTVDLTDEDEPDTMSPTIVTNADGNAINIDFVKLSFGQQLVNQFLGLGHEHQRYSFPAEFLFSRETRDSPNSNYLHSKARRSRSWHSETTDHRRQGSAGSQASDPRGRKFVKRLVDIRELNEQAKVIDDLKKLGASEGTINQEIQRYQQLESVAVNDIRRDVRKKLRRSSMRAASLKDKWGLGYKPSYNRSKTISSSGRPPLRRLERTSIKKDTKGKGSGGVKTAKLYAWVALQSLPEEMVISPCLLDFLEKALETIPITPVERNYTALSSQDEDVGQFEVQDPLEESTISLVSSSTSSYSSFPVDVVVYVRVQPSQIKFSCLPVSRVECMLKLPSLDLVFSSNRSDLESLGFSHAFDGAQVSATATSLLAHTVLKSAANKTGTSTGFGSPLGRSRHSSSQSDLSYSSPAASGLSFTACMSDFSLYVFHPYGTGKQKTTVTGLTPGSSAPGTVDEEASSVTGRKDSLSINLEFVKVSLSRMRRSGGGSLFDNQTPIKINNKMETTLINISAVCDIGSASFKYDMRRLSEILAFPRAWYRRSIARRLFLGDQTINLPASGPVTPDSIESQHLSPESTRKAYWRTWEQSAQSSSYSHVAQTANVFSDHTASSSTSPAGLLHSVKSPSAVRSRTISDSSAPRRDSVTKISTPSFSKNGKMANQQAAPWETLVVFAINLKQLNVQMNMSNVMGNTTWTTSGLKSQGRLSVGSNRDREISMSVGLGRSQLDSKGGVVGGTIDVNTLEMVSHISEHPNQQPSHKIQITLGSTDARVDYMGSSILMGIFSNADLQLQDEWKVNLHNTIDLSMTEKSEVFVHGDLQWDIFQVMISRSTTPDLIKIGMKLQEFFTQQFDTSKRALSTWGPVLYIPPKTPVINVERSSSEHLLDAAHHRHWPEVLKVIAGCQISLFQMPLPEDAVQLGGSMSLHGNHMTLACFHGPNFRSKSWALFHLEEPNIAFWTEAQKIWEDGASDHSTYIVQTLDFHLGHNTMVTKPGGALESPMATITKITRRRHENPPHGVANVQEWFNYVTAMRNEELNLLRNVDANTTDSKTTIKSSNLLSGFRGTANYNHETETIFALPRMQLDFKSIHMQEPQEPSLQDPNSKPKVECSVVTEFTDHICVTMDAELIMFLHDLVSAYLKEKEKAIFPPRIVVSRPGQKSPIIAHDDSSTDKTEEVIYTTVDWREFVCNTWHLEPTLRLISWTGRKIDPVGVDYILQKLGFHHARITIPKWVQRGVMDPLDKVLSVLIKKLGVALQDEKEKKGKDKEEHQK
uniref:bridge-like lipid transfer protein family member 1 n=1 Tax=Pristiophorus japonicus TaxID=55135 RepID=UPI00398F7960